MVILFFVVELVMIEVFLIKGGFLYMVIKEKINVLVKIFVKIYVNIFLGFFYCLIDKKNKYVVFFKN